MSSASQTTVKKLVVLAALAGLWGSLAFLLVGCGGRDSAPSARPHAAAAWRLLPKAPVEIDASLDSVWTGKELIVSGVRFGPGGTFIGSENVAAAYNPATRAWRRLSPAPMMDNYCHRGVAWTGTEMLLWGCRAAAFDLQADAWR